MPCHGIRSGSVPDRVVLERCPSLVYGGRLEICWVRKCLVGSNPTLSAMRKQAYACLDIDLASQAQVALFVFCFAKIQRVFKMNLLDWTVGCKPFRNKHLSISITVFQNTNERWKNNE